MLVPTTCTQPMALQAVLTIRQKRQLHHFTAAVVLHYVSSLGNLAPKIHCALLC